MEAIDLAAERSFGERHFGGCDLGDERLTRRVVATADAFMRHPGGTFPDKLSDPAMLKGFYRLANNKKVKRQNLIAMHHRYTLERMRTVNGVVLVLHDTTELVFGGLDVDDLGPVGNGSEQGLLCHNSLAVDYDGHEVIGLANQVLQRRREVPQNESARQKREHPDRESRLWVKGVAGMPRRPEGAMWIHVADRGSDTFEFIDWAEREQHLYCIRSKSNRGIEVCVDGEWKEKKLHDYARTLATLSHRTVEVQGRDGGKSRKAKVRVAASELRLRPPVHPNRGEHGDEPLRAWVVHVLEEKPPKGVEPLEWILLTNVEVRTAEDAEARVDWYCSRWIIEEYHKAQKTGCGVESQQFTTRKALEVAVAILSVVATQLLRLRDLARSEAADRTPATEVVDEDYVLALTARRSRNRERRADLTVREFLYGVARLGGHQGRRHDGPPGWLVLWRGWMKLQLLVEGARGAKLERCG
jgi:hypothetical protein